MLTAAAVVAVVAGFGLVPFAQPVTAAPKPACPAQRVDEASALIAARGCAGRVEVEGRRSETTQVWANADGTLTAHVFTGPVRMRDADGTWVPVDLTLRANADGSVTPRAHPNGLRLSGPVGAGTHDLVGVVANGHWVTMGWVGALPRPALSGATATYREVRPGVDLVVTATRTGFEELLVVKNEAAVDSVGSVTVPLRAAGLSIVGDAAGNMNFRDAAGTVVGTSSVPVMFDAARDSAGQPAQRMVVATRSTVSPQTRGANGAMGGMADLQLSPDQTYLRDPARQFPITIDPGVTSGPTGWAQVAKEFPTTAFWMQNDPNGLGVGDAPSATGQPMTDRLLWSLPLPSSLVGASISSASFNVHQVHSWDCQPQPVVLYRTGPISPSTTWNNQPVGDAPSGIQSSAAGCPLLPPSVVSWDARSAVVSALNEGQPNVTVGLRAFDETSSSPNWHRYTPDNAVLTVTYAPSPVAGSTGSPHNATELSFGLTDKLSAQVNVASGNLLVESADMTLAGIGTDVTLGAAYNSLLVGSSLQTGAFGPGWRTLSGADVKLVVN
ncbi:MAG: hypothetical protein QOI74_1543, partial [Micromonosporaceae bacterium]|nr:hypothetical protein [Micromonosporaceae bacterium]